jgi:hypothetical protein
LDREVSKVSNGKLGYEFQKNSAESVITSFTTFKGKKLVNLRVYYNAGVDQDEWRPSPEACAYAEPILELKQAIDRAAQEWEKENFLEQPLTVQKKVGKAAPGDLEGPESDLA